MYKEHACDGAVLVDLLLPQKPSSHKTRAKRSPHVEPELKGFEFPNATQLLSIRQLLPFLFLPSPAAWPERSCRRCGTHCSPRCRSASIRSTSGRCPHTDERSWGLVRSRCSWDSETTGYGVRKASAGRNSLSWTGESLPKKTRTGQVAHGLVAEIATIHDARVLVIRINCGWDSSGACQDILRRQVQLPQPPLQPMSPRVQHEVTSSAER